jgi:hypothetical protein
MEKGVKYPAKSTRSMSSLAQLATIDRWGYAGLLKIRRRPRHLLGDYRCCQQCTVKVMFVSTYPRISRTFLIS